MNERDPTDIAAEQAEADARATERANAQATEVEDYRWLMSTERGRRILWRFYSLTHPFQPSFGGGRENTDFREGERNIGLKLQAALARADVKQFAQMMQEHMIP